MVKRWGDGNDDDDDDDDDGNGDVGTSRLLGASRRELRERRERVGKSEGVRRKKEWHVRRVESAEASGL